MATFLANEINATERDITGPTEQVQIMFPLRTFARNFSNIDFFLKILPLKDDELAMSEM